MRTARSLRPGEQVWINGRNRTVVLSVPVSEEQHILTFTDGSDWVGRSGAALTVYSQAGS
jgi:hypothetical protein